jgi:hypothetical protein
MQDFFNLDTTKDLMNVPLGVNFVDDNITINDAFIEDYAKGFTHYLPYVI